MSTSPPTPVTLWHRSNEKGSRWQRIGTAAGYAAAIDLGERAGIRGGKWWLDTSPVTDREASDDEHESVAERRSRKNATPSLAGTT